MESSAGNKEFFREVYRHNTWKGEHSRSGPGSEGAFAAKKAEILRQWIGSHRVRSLLDIGCGDFYWMREIVPLLDVYVGVDIVPELIAENSRFYGADKVTFLELDLTVPGAAARLPRNNWDLITCVDVFGHLVNDEVSRLLGFLTQSAGARYLLVTNRRDADSSAYLSREKSRDEGIDIEFHPIFQQSAFRRTAEMAALYPGDFFDLYATGER
jgi:hypothetical protein